MNRFCPPLAFLALLLAIPAQAATEFVVMTVEKTDPESCRKSVEALLVEQGVPNGQENGELLSVRICALENPSLALVKTTPDEEPKEDPSPHAFTLDVTGGYSAGNQQSGNVGGKFAYTGDYGTQHSLNLVFTGEYRLENDGNNYHKFEAASTYSYNVDPHWSLFVLASVGRDSKKQIAFVAKELGGVMYDIFGDGTERDLKLSVGVGHQYEQLMDGTLAGGSSNQALNNNNAIASYRIKYVEKALFGDHVNLVAAVWFQHVLYSPANDETGSDARIMDVSDFRLMAELGLKIKLAEFAPGVEMYANFEGTYEYFVNAVSDSPYDLVLKGGLGVSF